MSAMEWLLTGAVIIMLGLNLMLGKWLTEIVGYYKELSKDYKAAVKGWNEANERTAELLIERLRRDLN